jgi:hypothetical protein
MSSSSLESHDDAKPMYAATRKCVIPSDSLRLQAISTNCSIGTCV